MNQEALEAVGSRTAIARTWGRFGALVVLVVVIAPLALVPGCIGYTPQPLDPGSELELLDLRGHTDVAIAAVAPGRASWFPLQADVSFADGLTIGEANALALFYAPEVLRARSAARVAGAQLLQAGLLSNPELFVGPMFSLRDADRIFPAGLSWELPLWGKQDAERSLADARLSAGGLQVLDVEMRVLGEVRELYIRLALSERELGVYEKLVRDSERVVQWVEGLARAGEVDAVTLYLARLERDQANALAEAKRVEIETASRDLLEMIGMLPTAAVHIVLDPDPSQLPEVGDSSQESLLRHPELRVAEADYRAAEAALELEITKQYPDISLGALYEYDRGDPFLGFGLSVTLPLFDRNRGGIAEAEERRQAARESYRDALLGLSHVEARARADLGAARRLLEIHRTGALSDAADATRSLEIRLRSGEANVLEVLAVQRAITRSRIRELELEEQAAIARLRTAIAGGMVLNEPLPSESEERR